MQIFTLTVLRQDDPTWREQTEFIGKGVYVCAKDCAKARQFAGRKYAKASKKKPNGTIPLMTYNWENDGFVKCEPYLGNNYQLKGQEEIVGEF